MISYRMPVLHLRVLNHAEERKVHSKGRSQDKSVARTDRQGPDHEEDEAEDPEAGDPNAG